MMSQSLDRGLLYGDGFFTTLLVEAGQLANWPAHWRRLQLSAQRLKFPPLSQSEVLAAVRAQLKAEAFDSKRSLIKILITRGEGGVGYQPLAQPQPRIRVQSLPFPQGAIKNDQAWSLFTVKMTLSAVRVSQQPILAGLKHCNRLENVLAREALLATHFDEAIMLGQQGEVICATQANLILLKGNQLITPQLSESGVLGTCLSSLPKALTFNAAGDSAKSQWQWQIRPVALDELAQADEILCCNAVRGVMPVTQFQNRDYQTQKGTQIAQAWLKWQSQNLFQL